MQIRSLQLFLTALTLSALLSGLTGCGSGLSGENSSVTSVASVSSRECISCHTTNQRAVSKTSGVNITEQWQLSAHNTAEGAGCVDCHGYHYQYITSAGCRNCHAKAHENNGKSCSSCHGGGAKETADCITCHEMTRLHKNPPVANPDSAGKCFGCHSNGNNFKRYTAVAAKHFNNFNDSGVHPAKYVTVNYQDNCTACHEPHNPLTGLGNKERKDWADSGHGNVNALAWANRDFKNGSTSCIRCHTATGFINYVDSGYILPTTTWASASDKGREVLTCKACHVTSNFKGSVRRAGPFTATYDSMLTFPQVNESNLCIPCHAGRENGTSVKTISNFSNASFKNPHYLAAAAVFYGVGGFQYYSSASQTPYYPQAYTSKYGVVVDGTIIKAAPAASYAGGTPAITVGDSLTGRKAPWSHGKLGMNNYTTAALVTTAIKTTRGWTLPNVGKIRGAGDKGQCVACHLGPTNTHSFDAFEAAKASWGTATNVLADGNGAGSGYGCYGCHSGEDMKEIAELDEKPKFDAAMTFFEYELQKAGFFYYGDAHPYFYTALYDKSYKESGACSSNLPVKNWQAGGTSTFTWNATTSSCTSVAGTKGVAGTGAANMGAAMNYKLLTAEKGAHVHNRTFMKQLIFDSIQYLQTGNVSFSNRYITSGSTADPNGLINFSSYSTALISTGKAGATTATVRGYITRKNTGSSGAIGSTATPLYTRP